MVREGGVQEWGSEPGVLQGLLARWATLCAPSRSPGLSRLLEKAEVPGGAGWVGSRAAAPAAWEPAPSQQSMQDVRDVWQPLRRLFHCSVGFRERLQSQPSFIATCAARR